MGISNKLFHKHRRFLFINTSKSSQIFIECLTRSKLIHNICLTPNSKPNDLIATFSNVDPIPYDPDTRTLICSSPFLQTSYNLTMLGHQEYWLQSRHDLLENVQLIRSFFRIRWHHSRWPAKFSNYRHTSRVRARARLHGLGSIIRFVHTWRLLTTRRCWGYWFIGPDNQQVGNHS